jgi:outer membrane receptor protein involved in Fe transport
MKRELLVLAGAAMLAAGSARVADARTSASEAGAPTAVTDEAAQAPTGAPAADQKPPEDTTAKFKEDVVVSASRVESRTVDAPATMSVINSDRIEASPAQNHADLLRSVPGMNVVQTSARDINLTTRQATSTLNNSQLVMVDGRSVYLDFFGLVLWDFVPNPASGDIQQIEVVRGPASVVWGANALTGVVNIITKSPRDHQGFGINLSAGLFSRDGGSRAGSSGQQYNGNFTFASAVNDKVSYKLTAGYYKSDPYSRPVGTVPLDCHPYGVIPCRDAKGKAVPGGFPVGGAPYPADKTGLGSWQNNGTSQPKVMARLDQELGAGGSGGRITYEGGYAGTDGIIHTGIGPFDIQSDSYMAYGKAVYTKSSLRVGAFANFVDANAPNLLLSDPATGQPIVLGFKTQTYDFDVSNSTVLGGKHILTYGGNVRRNNFDITLAPGAKDRNDFGAYLQEEFYVDKFRLAVGGRADKAGNLDHWFFSPRVSVMFKPTTDQSVRLSYNRAFRAPSVINNYLDQDILSPSTVDLRPLGAVVPPLKPLIPQEPFYLVVNNFGNPKLEEEHVDAFELAYTARVGNTSFGLAIYQNDTQNNINFTTLLPDSENPQGLPGLEYYSAANPAQGVGAQTGQLLIDPLTGKPGLSPILMGALAQVPAAFGGPILLPYKVATYLNLGPLRNRGIELSIEQRVNNHWTLGANYSYQIDPKVLDADPGQIRYPISEVGLPPKNRFNAQASYNGPRLLGNLSVNYTDRAFWNDVLSAPYYGWTDSYTLVNATVGVKFAQGKAQFSLRGMNLLNQEIMQHIYGDIMRISVMAELRYFSR